MAHPQPSAGTRHLGPYTHEMPGHLGGEYQESQFSYLVFSGQCHSVRGYTGETFSPTPPHTPLLAQVFLADTSFHVG